jgi:hypothetical protein
MHGGLRNAEKISVVKPEGMRQFGTPHLICEENIKMNLKATERFSVGWIHLAQIGNNCKFLRG